MELFPDFDFEAKPKSEPELAAVQLPAAPAISDEVQKRLVKLANEVCKLEPWLEIHESELFGIADPDSKLVNWCSVIGGGGDVFAIQFHEPPEAIKFWNKAFCDEEPNMGPGLPDTRLLECSLTPLEDVEEEDLAMASVLRKLPKKVKSIPCFRSFRPGFIPWFIDENDAQRLCLFLEVFTKFFTRVYDDYSRYHDTEVKIVYLIPKPCEARLQGRSR